MSDHLRLWLENPTTKEIVKGLEKRRQDLIQELIDTGKESVRFSIQELDFILDRDNLSDFITKEVADEI